MAIAHDNFEVPDYANMLRLDGLVFIVLGAGMGIGYQTSHALASVGAKVVCVDLDAERAASVAAEVGGVAKVADATDREQSRALFESVPAELGRLDGVVDIIGMSRYRPVAEFSDDDWHWHYEINFKHAYLAIAHASRYWKASGTSGSVTVVGSILGMESAPKVAAYGAYKAALNSLVKTAAVELGPDGIRVNAVAPGVIRTPRAVANPKWTPDLLDSNTKKTPLGRLGYPSDVAATLLFLASPLAAHISGQSIVVDGGMMVTFPVDAPEPD